MSYVHNFSSKNLPKVSLLMLAKYEDIKLTTIFIMLKY